MSTADHDTSDQQHLDEAADLLSYVAGCGAQSLHLRSELALERLVRVGARIPLRRRGPSPETNQLELVRQALLKLSLLSEKRFNEPLIVEVVRAAHQALAGQR
jgi:hypothetical protein